MELETSIKSKLTNQFWKVKLKEELVEGLPSSFFVKEIVEKSEFDNTISLDFPQILYDKIFDRCNNNPILSYVYFLTALHITLIKYGVKRSVPICHGGFEKLNSTPGIVFYPINCKSSESFKELFLRIRQEVAEVSLHPIEFTEDLDNFDYLQSIGFHIEGLGRSPQEFKPCEWMLKLESANDEIKLSIESKLNANSNIQKGFLQSFIHILNQSIEDSQLKINEISALDDNQRYIVLEEFNATKQGRPIEHSIVEILESNALEMANRIAVQFKNNCWSYSQLNARVNQIAALIQNVVKLKREDRILIFVERSDLFLMSVLAAWKNGACYIPIDPIYPDERIIEILESASPALVISQSKLLQREKLKNVFSLYNVLDLEISKAQIEIQCTSNLNILLDNNQLAYIIYTSGSTGKPKGVMIEHKGMLNHIFGKIDVLDINENSIVVQNASQGFDISIWQMFAALIEGGKTVIYDDNLVYNTKKFINCVEDDQVTILELVPSYFLELLNILELVQDVSFWSNMDHLVLNAETLKHDMVQRWFKLFPEKKISNTYGATEVSDDTSHFVMTEQPNSLTVPVMKRPFPNFKLYVVDKNISPCPIGVIGDIYIAGFAVGRGYFNDKEKTNASFITNPIYKGEYEKLYKTGDLGRYLSCGSLEFIGRKDHQVKVRGHRVELGDIENQLLKISGVNNAIVIDLLDELGQVFLIAYVDKKMTFSGELLSEEIKDQLKIVLPAYLVPRFVVVMPYLPLNSNGKIDRKKLSNPNLQSINNDKHIHPRNESEIKIVKIWEELLQRKDIGIKDDFFALGGHSLKVMSLINEYYKTFSVKINLRDLFLNSTLESHSLIIMSIKKIAYLEIKKIEKQINYVVSDAQKRIWILSQYEQTSIAYNNPYLAELEGNYDEECFKRAIDSTIERHEALRTVFREDESGELKQWILSSEDLKFKCNLLDFRAIENKEENVKSYFNNDSNKVFDLEKGPLFRGCLIRLSEDKYIFYYNIHHIISDGWSMDVLTSNILSYYNAYKAKQKPNLPKLKIQYKDYAVWQINQFNNEEYKNHRNYWVNKFSGELQPLDLPHQKMRPKIKTYNGSILKTYITKELSQKLGVFCIEHKGSLFIGLLTTWKILFSRYTNKKDIIIATPVAGREHAELKDQIGIYLNTLVLRNEIDINKNFVDTFLKITDTTISSYEHQMYSYDRLLDDLNLKRDIGRNPLFDVMLSLHNTKIKEGFVFSEEDELFKISNQGSTNAKLDIIINMEEHGEYLYLDIHYNTDIYDEVIIKGLMNDYKLLLNELLENPFEKIGLIDYQKNNAQSLKNKNQNKLNFFKK